MWNYCYRVQRDFVVPSKLPKPCMKRMIANSYTVPWKGY